MDIWHIITLAILQGLTEFLPISSSAHLILLPHLMGWDDQGLAFDVALHVGTLSAVLFYFRHDLKPLLQSWWLSLRTRQLTPESRLVWGIGVGTLPVGIVGLAISIADLENNLRDPLVIAAATIVFGVLLWWADTIGQRQRDEYSLSWQDILLVGLAQALALIPGTSRSGITMTAGLLLGLKRQAAARFSFLLSIPTIILAGASEAVLLLEQATPVAWTTLLWGALLSALSAYVCIFVFIRLLERIGMLPFALYRLVLGFVLLVWIA